MTRLRRGTTAVVLSLACAAGTILAAVPAGAQPVASGTFTATIEPGGDTVTSSTAAGATFGTSTGSENGDGPVHWVQVAVNEDGAPGWGLVFQAPSGRTLEPGRYDDAVRSPFGTTSPGLVVDGPTGSCDSTGTFTVTRAVFGGSGWVESFHATFERTCVGGGEVVRGTIAVDNQPQPPPLILGATIKKNGTVDPAAGTATVGGTVTCTQPGTVTFSGTVIQVVRRIIVTADYYAQQECTPGTAVPWRVTATPRDGSRFKAGDAEVHVDATAQDVVTGAVVQVSKTKIVTLAA